MESFWINVLTSISQIASKFHRTTKVKADDTNYLSDQPIHG